MAKKPTGPTIDALIKELEVEGWKPTLAALEHFDEASERNPPQPKTEEDLVFRREVAGRLVSTWLESYRLNKPEGRLFLETAMGNVRGLRQIGEEGERVPFNGKYHECDTTVAGGTYGKISSRLLRKILADAGLQVN